MKPLRSRTPYSSWASASRCRVDWKRNFGSGVGLNGASRKPKNWRYMGYLFAADASGLSMETSDWLLWATKNEPLTTSTSATAMAATASPRCRRAVVRSASVTIRGMVESRGTPAVSRTSSARR